MRKLLLMFVLSLLWAGATGCGCCRGMFGSKPTTVARPITVPAPAPACAPACDPCGNSGVTYGAPGATFGAPTLAAPGAY